VISRALQIPSELKAQFAALQETSVSASGEPQPTLLETL